MKKGAKAVLAAKQGRSKKKKREKEKQKEDDESKKGWFGFSKRTTYFVIGWLTLVVLVIVLTICSTVISSHNVERAKVEAQKENAHYAPPSPKRPPHKYRGRPAADVLDDPWDDLQQLKALPVFHTYTPPPPHPKP